MASVQDRTKLKRVSYDTWSTREQLCLASSVLKAGDQNWIGVSRSLKPFAEKEALRPPDWFSQKSCAMQYAILLENADAPKRKKRESGETTGESIVRRLTQERIAELGQILAFQRDEYQQLKAEVNILRSGSITEEKLQKMWMAIEQEEREQEQKARAHSAWLAKRQQKQEVQSLQTVSVGGTRKTLETTVDAQENMESTNEDEEKKNRGGRSPLLTSLLKSPSPTTQIQNPSSSAQVTSPTIASLLGSSPKVPNPQSTQSAQPQLHQLVSTAITSVVQERPSVGAPTLSMLLELPANLQRAALANLQTVVTSASQQAVPPEIHVQSHQLKQTTTTINDASIVRQPTIYQPNIPVTESMVQIIDHIDDVIRKDIMADVIDKDEINEIIGDIEELIKEEITSSPQKITDTVSTKPEIIENLSVTEIEKIVVPERPEPRDVDEAVSLSNSPQSEMAIEEIDQSTSSIAEIIGTVAIEPVEPKITVPAPEEVTEDKTKEEQAKNDAKPEEEPPASLPSEVETKKEDVTVETNTTSENVEEKIIDEPEEKSQDIAVSENESKTPEPLSKSSPESITEKESDDAEPTAITSEIDDSGENSVEQKESPAETKDKNDLELDQIEMHLAKITGDQNETVPAEVGSVSSEVTTDVASIEDNEKSQDISMILEDDESSQSSSSKKKDVDEQLIGEIVADASDSQESFKESSASKDESKDTVIETPTEDTAPGEVTSDKDEEETVKIEISKESEDSMSPALPEIEKIEKSEDAPLSEVEKITDLIKTESEEKVESAESPKLQAEDPDVKKCDSPVAKIEKSDVKEEFEADTLIEQLEEPKKEESEVKEEDEETKASGSDLSIKKETGESAGSIGDDIADLDEEESSLSKLSGGRAMKTYSKKQTIAVDSEPDIETSGENADYRAWKKAVVLMYNRLATHKYASIFLRPITEDQAPGYHSVIFRPMDLSTIKKNIDNGTIRTTMHFQRDVMLMFQNAIMYNKHDTFVYKMAVSMQEECLQHMQILVQVTGEGQLRRETRTAASSSSETSDTSVKRKRSHITPSPHDSESPRGSKKRRKSEND